MSNLSDQLLASLNLTRTEPPTAAQWSLFLEKVEADIGKLKRQNDSSEEMLQLSFNEMKEWSLLVDLRESTLKSIMDSSSDLIITLDNTGHVTEFNRAAEEKFGVEKEKIRGLSLFDVLANSPFLNHLKSIIESKNFSQGGKEYLKQSIEVTGSLGQCFFADVFVSRIKVGQGFIYAVYIRDLTEELRSKAALDLIRQQAAYNNKLASLGEMAAGVAHEINNPLTIISLSCRTLTKIAEAESLDRAMMVSVAASISTTTDRIAKIVRGLSTFSRQSKINETSDVSVKELISETLDLCRERFKSAGISLTFEGDDQEDIHCHQVYISQVLLNLLNNAFDAIQALDDKWVAIKYESNDSTQFISVTDSGSGIAPEIVLKIMEPFFTTKEVGKGTGLGLSISKGIIETHGGRFEYDSRSPNTRFIIALPRYTPKIKVG